MGARLSVCMWRAHVITSSCVRTCSPPAVRLCQDLKAVSLQVASQAGHPALAAASESC